MDPSNANTAMSPSASSRPYPATMASSDDYPHRFQQHRASRLPPPPIGARPITHDPMASASISGSADDLPSMSASAGRRHYYGREGYHYGNVGTHAHAQVEDDRRGAGQHRHPPHPPPSAYHRTHHYAHVHQPQPPPYQHAYSDPTLPTSARLPAYPPNAAASPPQPPPTRKPFPPHASARPLLPSGVTPTLPGYASPFSPIDRFHPSPYAPTVSSGPSPAQSAPRSAGLHDYDTVRGVTQTPNWNTQTSYTPNSAFSSYPNTPAGVGASGGVGLGGPGLAADAGHLSTTTPATAAAATTPAHMGQHADGHVDDASQEDFEGIPPGHVPVDAWGPHGPPAHVREMMRKRPLFEGGRVRPASPPNRYLGVECAGVDAEGPQLHRRGDTDGMRSPMGIGARSTAESSVHNNKTGNVGGGGGASVNNSADTSDWTTSERNELFDSESVTKGPAGTVRRAYTSTTLTVTHHHHHHHHHRSPLEAPEHHHAPPSVAESSAAANAATSDSMDVASPTRGDRPHRANADASEDDWSECKTTVTHTTTTRRAPQHHHLSHAYTQPLEQTYGHAIGSPNAVAENPVPVAQDDEKHTFARHADTHTRTSSSRECERERDMPAPPPYYDGAIPPPPPTHTHHVSSSSSTTARRSGPPPPAGSNSASVYFGNRRGGYLEDDRLPPPGTASRAYWSDRERMMLMMDRDRADRDRHYRGYPPAPAGGYYPSPPSYPPPPSQRPPPLPHAGQYDIEVRHMTAEYPPRVPPPPMAPASVLPPLDEHERRIWAMSKRRDGLADGVDERDRVRYDDVPPAGYRSLMPAGRGRYWGAPQPPPHETYASASTRFHQHPAGYYRSYDEYMHERREREYAAATMDRGRVGGGAYDRSERGVMPPPPVAPSPPIVGFGRGEPSEWAAPRAPDAQSEGPPPYDVGSWQEQQMRGGSPQRGRPGGRAGASHASVGALGPVNSGQYGARPDSWRHPSQLPPIDTRSMSAGSQTAHASTSASPQRHDQDAHEPYPHAHERLNNNVSPAARRPQQQQQPYPQPPTAQASAPSAAAPVSNSNVPSRSLPDTQLLQLGPNMGTTSIGLAIMAAIDDGEIGKRRDYLTFTRSTYTEMIECLRRPNELLAPHITDRRRWKRLMNLLVEHPGQPTYQSLTWKQCPLWIVPHEDWDQLIWEHHYANGQPGIAECNTVAKTARMIGRLYQTRRSRCGIFIEYIAQLLAMCPHCAGGEDGAKILSKAKGKITIGQQVQQARQQSQSAEREEAAASASASAPGGAGASSSQATSHGADLDVPHSPHSPTDQQPRQPFVLAPDGVQDPPAPLDPPPAHAYLPFSYLPDLPLVPLDAAPLAPADGDQQESASVSALPPRDPSLSPPSSGASQRMLLDGEGDGEIGSQQHDPLFSDPPPDPHVVFQDRR